MMFCLKQKFVNSSLILKFVAAGFNMPLKFEFALDSGSLYLIFNGETHYLCNSVQCKVEDARVEQFIDAATGVLHTISANRALVAKLHDYGYGGLFRRGGTMMRSFEDIIEDVFDIELEEQDESENGDY